MYPFRFCLDSSYSRPAVADLGTFSVAARWECSVGAAATSAPAAPSRGSRISAHQQERLHAAGTGRPWLASASTLLASMAARVSERRAACHPLALAADMRHRIQHSRACAAEMDGGRRRRDEPGEYRVKRVNRGTRAGARAPPPNCARYLDMLRRRRRAAEPQRQVPAPLGQERALSSSSSSSHPNHQPHRPRLRQQRRGPRRPQRHPAPSARVRQHSPASGRRRRRRWIDGRGHESTVSTSVGGATKRAAVSRRTSRARRHPALVTT
eukprot:scaffold1558_cov403-Prasinococcus_capsulatus_cf.AAC.26